MSDRDTEAPKSSKEDASSHNPELEHIIGRIGVHNHKMTYTHGDYLIHYTCENKLVYMCITDNVGERTAGPVTHRLLIA